MNIKKLLLNCLAFGSFSCTQAFGFQVYSDGPGASSLTYQPMHMQGFFLNCGFEGAENINLLDNKVNEIVSQEKYKDEIILKEKLSEIAKITDPQAKLTAYMGLIGLNWMSVGAFLDAKREGLKCYAETLQGNTNLSIELGLDVLVGLQSAINEYRGRSQQPAQKA